MPLPTNFVKKNIVNDYDKTTVEYLKTIYYRYVANNSDNYGYSKDFNDYTSENALTQLNAAVDYYNANNLFSVNDTTGIVTFNITQGEANNYVVPYSDYYLKSLNTPITTLIQICNDFNISNKTYATNNPYIYTNPVIDSFNYIVTTTLTVWRNANLFLKKEVALPGNNDFTITLDNNSVLTLTNIDKYVENLKQMHILKQTINSIKNSTNFTNVNYTSSPLKINKSSTGSYGDSYIEISGIRVNELFNNLYNALDSVINILKGVLRYVYDAAVANATKKLESAKLLIRTSEDKNPIAFKTKNIAIGANTGKVALATTEKNVADLAKNAANDAMTAAAYLASKKAAEEANTAAIDAKNAVDAANNDITAAKTAAIAANKAAIDAKNAATLAVTLTTALNTSITNENTIYTRTTPMVNTFDDTAANAAADLAGQLLDTATQYVRDLADYVIGGSRSASVFATNANDALVLANTLAGMNILNKYQGTTNDALNNPVDSATSIQTTVDYITTKTRELYQMSGSNVDTYKSQYSQTMAFGAVLTIILSILIYFVFSNIYNEGLGSSGNGSSNMPLSNGSPGT